MVIFISYCSKNDWVLEGLLKLIREACPGIEIFVTYEGVIPPGKNYKTAIYESIKKAEWFLPILSGEYWQSKYCIMELGAAYERYCSGESVTLFPMLLPPLGAKMALSNTPMVEMEAASLTDGQKLLWVLRTLHGSACPGSLPDDLDRFQADIAPRVSEYASHLNTAVLAATDLTAIPHMSVDTFLDERPDAAIPRHDLIRCERPEQGVFRVHYDFTELDYRPRFGSLALIYRQNPVDFHEFIRYDMDAAFCCTIENPSGSLKSISIEWKDYAVHAVELSPGSNAIRIPICPERDLHPPKSLCEIFEICFVIHPDDLADPSIPYAGTFTIRDLRIDFKGRNILEEG